VTARIQECHITIGHLLCEAVDEAFAPALDTSPEPAGPAKLRTLEPLIAWREAQRARNRTVVWTNGVFDVFHAGHLASLRGARRFGDRLVVGVNGDASVRANKGPERPIFRCEERVELLAALDVVDAIVVFDDPTPERVLAQLRPDVHVKGADYAPPNGKPIPERAIVEGYGGRIEFVPLVPGRSSTDTLARLRS
jgi:rfaE bifunctional protein nucleotidyltransferase chain/domain